MTPIMLSRSPAVMSTDLWASATKTQSKPERLFTNYPCSIPDASLKSPLETSILLWWQLVATVSILWTILAQEEKNATEEAISMLGDLISMDSVMGCHLKNLFWIHRLCLTFMLWPLKSSKWQHGDPDHLQLPTPTKYLSGDSWEAMVSSSTKSSNYQGLVSKLKSVLSLICSCFKMERCG